MTDPLKITPVPDLTAVLHALVRQIPIGRVSTYGDLANALGDIRAARWVAVELAEEGRPVDLPVHRVVRKSGDHGADAPARWESHLERLSAEGVPHREGIVDLAAHHWNDFTTDRPLQTLQEWQNEVATRTQIVPLKTVPRRVAGVDLAYPTPGEGLAAYVEFDPATRKIVWSATYRGPVLFPYISGYLTFRELPLLLPLLEQVRVERGHPDLVFVDGNGILHPRRCGIATTVGNLLGLPTIGISKRLLSDRLDDATGAISDGEGRVIGQRDYGTSRARPYFISPGHRIDVAGAIEWTRHFQVDHALPETTYWADWLSHSRPLP